LPEPESWRAILETLEGDLARVKSGDVLEATAWTAPTAAGPLPDEYAHYVRALIESQREAIVEVAAARRRTAEHIAAVQSVAATRAAPHSVYLDVEG